MISASFYGWLPLYLPELFPTAVRATGQGFGFNFGRIIAAAGNLQMANLLAAFDNDYAQACAIVAGVYVVGLVLIAVAPETKGKPLPDVENASMTTDNESAKTRQEHCLPLRSCGCIGGIGAFALRSIILRSDQHFAGALATAGVAHRAGPPLVGLLAALRAVVA